MLLITKLTKQILLEAKLISKDYKVLTTLVVQNNLSIFTVKVFIQVIHQHISLE